MGSVGFRAASSALARLPFGAVRRLGWAGGLAAHRRWHDRREMAERHMARIVGGDPDHVDDRARAAARDVFTQYGVYVAETLWMRERRLDAVAAGLVIEGKQHFDEAVAAGGGVILALPHIGNWEFAAVHPLRVGVPLVAVAEDLADPEMTAWYREMRARIGIRVELAGDPTVTRTLVRALAANEAVALVTDRDVTGSGAPVEFFGETTSMPVGPGTLARLSGAPLLPVACYLTDRGHRIVVRPPVPVPRTSDRRADARAAVATLAGEFEHLVAADPTQWHLLQPQWPSDPGWRWGQPA